MTLADIDYVRFPKKNLFNVVRGVIMRNLSIVNSRQLQLYAVIFCFGLLAVLLLIVVQPGSKHPRDAIPANCKNSLRFIEFRIVILKFILSQNYLFLSIIQLLIKIAFISNGYNMHIIQ